MAYTKQTWTDGSAGGTPVTAARLGHLEDGIAAAAVRLAVDVRDFGAVGDGSADDTAAIQTALNSGGHVHFPQQSTFKLTGTLTCSVAGTVLTGAGELRFVSGVSQSAGIKVTGSGSALHGLKLTNPNALGSQTGGRNVGVEIAANNVSVTRSLIDTFQNGIIVDADGEWENIILANNRIKDVIGAGDGPSNSTSTFGEDRGDGIVVWGAQAAIVGNVINCKVGSDARIGIHAEALAGTGAVTNVGHPDCMVAITGNVVFGQFRRGIVSEDVRGFVVTGNTVADSTWWGICLAGADTADGISGGRGSVVSGNAIMFTRAGTDNQGSAWGPIRAPLCLYGGISNSTISDNVVRVTGVADAGISVFGSSATRRAVNCTIANNSIVVETGGSMTQGLLCSGPATSLRVLNNTIVGFTSIGLYVNVDGVEVVGNFIDGVTSSGSSFGIRRDGNSATPTAVSGNTVRRVNTGVSWVNTTFARVNDNTIDTGAVGIELFGSSNCVVTGNLFNAVTTHLSNSAGAGVVANNS